jgi:hypothetical protein
LGHPFFEIIKTDGGEKGHDRQKFKDGSAPAVLASTVAGSLCDRHRVLDKKEAFKIGPLGPLAGWEADRGGGREKRRHPDRGTMPELVGSNRTPRLEKLRGP